MLLRKPTNGDNICDWHVGPMTKNQEKVGCLLQAANGLYDGQNAHGYYHPYLAHTTGLGDAIIALNDFGDWKKNLFAKIGIKTPLDTIVQRLGCLLLIPQSTLTCIHSAAGSPSTSLDKFNAFLDLCDEFLLAHFTPQQLANHGITNTAPSAPEKESPCSTKEVSTTA